MSSAMLAVVLGLTSGGLAGAGSTGGQLGGSWPVPKAMAAAVRGRVVVAGSRVPLAEIRVLAIPELTREPGRVPRRAHFDSGGRAPAWTRATSTAIDGSFTFEQLRPGRVRLVILAPGYAREEIVVDPTNARKPRVLVFLKREAGTAFRTVVQAQLEPEAGAVMVRDLSKEEIETASGSQGDPLRMLQNFPGVARTPGGLGLLILRGAAPNQSRVFFGEHPLPRAFHSLALSSLVPSAAIESLQFYPGNAPVRYGDLTGGAVVLKPARPRTDGYHGHGRVDLLGVGAVAQGPVGKASFLVAGQRGWVDGVLELAEKIDGGFSPLLPRYYDYQALVRMPLRGGAEFEVRVLGAGDRVLNRQRDYSGSAEVRGEPKVVFSFGSAFHRADLAFRKRSGPWSFLVSPTFRFERTTAGGSRTFQTARRDDFFVGWRVEAKRLLSRSTTLLFGTDGEVDPYRGMLLAQEGSGVVGSAKSQGTQSSIAVYALVDTKIANWSLAPGLRVAAYTLSPGATAFAVEPRIATRWSFAEHWTWSMGLGLTSQSVVAQIGTSARFTQSLSNQISGRVVLPASLLALEPRAGFQPERGFVTAAQALQASAAMAFEPHDDWALELGAFVRIREDRRGIWRRTTRGTYEVASAGVLNYDLAYGLEALVRRRLARGLYGWVGYTLAKVDRYPVAIPGVERRRTPSAFDQRHNLVVLASYQLPNDWRIGGRFRLVSGGPFTPIAGVSYDTRFAEPLLLFGPTNSARFPVFHQLDLRVDKRWVLRRTEVKLYMDVQNVYNRTNVEAYIYGNLGRNRISAVGLPIFPTLGLKVEY